jgi:predicted transposase YdaD
MVRKEGRKEGRKIGRKEGRKEGRETTEKICFHTEVATSYNTGTNRILEPGSLVGSFVRHSRSQICSP